MRMLETLPPILFEKAHDDSTFDQIWVDYWGREQIMDGNLLYVNASLLKRGKRIVVLEEYGALAEKIEADMQTGSLGCLVVGTPGIGASLLPFSPPIK